MRLDGSAHPKCTESRMKTACAPDSTATSRRRRTASFSPAWPKTATPSGSEAISESTPALYHITERKLMRFVVIHGGFHGAWCWSRTIPELERLGHEAIAIDMPGHGERLYEESTVQNRRDAVVS